MARAPLHDNHTPFRPLSYTDCTAAEFKHIGDRITAALFQGDKLEAARLIERRAVLASVLTFEALR